MNAKKNVRNIMKKELRKAKPAPGPMYAYALGLQNKRETKIRSPTEKDSGSALFEEELCNIFPLAQAQIV